MTLKSNWSLHEFLWPENSYHVHLQPASRWGQLHLPQAPDRDQWPDPTRGQTMHCQSSLQGKKVEYRCFSTSSFTNFHSCNILQCMTSKRQVAGCLFFLSLINVGTILMDPKQFIYTFHFRLPVSCVWQLAFSVWKVMTLETFWLDQILSQTEVLHIQCREL